MDISHNKFTILCVSAAVAGLVHLAAMAAPPRPPVHRPRPSPKPVKLRPAPKPPAPVVRTRLGPPKPVVITDTGTSVVVVDKTADSGSTDQAQPAGEATAKTAAPPADADQALAGSPAYKVVRLESDGLTVVLDVDGQETKVRMIGVVPLQVQGDRPDGPPSRSRLPRPSRPPMTGLFLTNLLQGESVHVVYDPAVEEEDSEGNCVAYLYRAPDGLLVNLEIIRQGFAAVDARGTFEEKATFLHYQDKARKLQKGQWRPSRARPTGPDAPPRDRRIERP